MPANNQTSNNGNSQGSSSTKNSSPIKVSLTSNLDSITSNGKAQLTFNFSDVPIGFTLDDIKVTDGVVTNLIQSKTAPNIFTADFTCGVNTKAPMSTIKLDGVYTDANGVNGTPSNTVTIKNDSATTLTTVPTAGFSSNNASFTEGNSGMTAFNFTVNLSKSSADPVTVYYTTQQKTFGTATANVDFVPVTSSIVFAPGETAKNISVNVIGDTIYEGNEYFYIDLTSAKGANIVTNGAEGLRNSWLMATIKNDDTTSVPTVGFTTNNASITEGNAGLTPFNFTVTLSQSAVSPVTVYYTTEKRTYGTASANTDYIPVTSSVVFSPGETSKVVTVNVIGDTTYEANEYFYLDLTSAQGANIVMNGAEGFRNNWIMATIKNDDATGPTVGFTTNNAAINEGNSDATPFNFTLTLSKSSTDPITVYYTTEKRTYGTATANADYTPVTSNVTFAPGETSKTITVNVLGDTTYEAKEYFYVDLTSAKGANIVTNGAEGLRNSWIMANIINDDSLETMAAAGIFGTPDKDTLGGTSAGELLDGKGGQDLITGYAGNDIFLLASSYAGKTIDSASLITDFKDGFDQIELQGDLAFNNLTITQGTGIYSTDTIVSLDTGDILVTLLGVDAASINAADFIHL